MLSRVSHLALMSCTAADLSHYVLVCFSAYMCAGLCCDACLLLPHDLFADSNYDLLQLLLNVCVHMLQEQALKRKQVVYQPAHLCTSSPTSSTRELPTMKR